MPPVNVRLVFKFQRQSINIQQNKRELHQSAKFKKVGVKQVVRRTF